MTLDKDEEEKICSIIEDVKHMRNKRGGLPNYVSKITIVRDLTSILGIASVSPEKKIEVLKLCGEMTDDFKNWQETNSCMELLLPPTIMKIGARDPKVQQAAIRLFQKALDKERHESQVLEHLADDGIRNRTDRVSIENTKIVPGIMLSKIEQLNMTHIIQALFQQLENRKREPYSFSALLRIRDAIGLGNFEEYTSQVPTAQNNLFKLMVKNNEDKDFHILKRRPHDGLSFGMIPNPIINKCLDRSSKATRADGTLSLKRELETNSDDLGLLLPYLGSFLRFLGVLLNDVSIKVVLSSLESHDVLIKKVPQSIKQHLNQTMDNLMSISLDSTTQIKIELYSLFKQLMLCCNPQPVVNILIQQLDHKNPKMREDVVNVITFALLTFPSNDFKLGTISQKITPSLIDPKRRVRQASLECIAVIAQCLGSRSVRIIFSDIQELQLGAYDKVADVLAAVQCRMSRKQLPKISADGFVEYGLNIPSNQFARSNYGQRRPTMVEGADVDWIQKGVGPLSKGSTGGSSSGSLGVNSAGSEFGSTLSLQSTRQPIRTAGAPRPKSGEWTKSDRDRSNSVNYDDDLNKNFRVPSISRKDGQRSKSESPTDRRRYSADRSDYDRNKFRNNGLDDNRRRDRSPSRANDMRRNHKNENRYRRGRSQSNQRDNKERSRDRGRQSPSNGYSKRESSPSRREESQQRRGGSLQRRGGSLQRREPSTPRRERTPPRSEQSPPRREPSPPRRNHPQRRRSQSNERENGQHGMSNERNSAPSPPGYDANRPLPATIIAPPTAGERRPDETDQEEPVDEVLSPRLSEEQLRKRRMSYDTLPRSESELDLRAAAQEEIASIKRSMSLKSVREEGENAPAAGSTDPQSFNTNQENNFQQNQENNNINSNERSGQRNKDNNDANDFPDLKRVSLASIGLAKSKYKTQFDEIIFETSPNAPGAFRRPDSAFRFAKTDLDSTDWKQEIEGLEAIVRLIIYHQNVIIQDIEYVSKCILEECKNLRSQVTRAAIQTFYILFKNLGRCMEVKTLDNIALLMLTKAADTNRFIRSDCCAVLDVMNENLSVARALHAFIKVGLEHKNVVARTNLARLMADAVVRIGRETVMNTSKDLLNDILYAGIKLLLDGSLDTRTEIKRMFKILINHNNFEKALKEARILDADIANCRKALDSLK